ncbi:uncharacterized protein LOC111072538 [Drosophila obscura]|uniref:uncharacterized protein LOC111072538 n=1 Tax=Drosophila obscura TaxID=7282 RepID=UPI000BA0AE87|nr:uncharacterized protein LOC111072538 [Drosophila obscura]
MDLRKLCRICFEGSAEVDINKHRPSDWPEHTVLEMIDATFQEKMDLTEQLAMICKTCLGNFMQIYAFSTKLKMANQQLLQLYIQAQGGEMYVVHEEDTIEEGCSLLEQEPETETIEQADALDFEPIDEGADMIDESSDIIDECTEIIHESTDLIDECPEIMEEFQSIDSEDGVAKPSQKLANLDSLIVSEFLPVTTSKTLGEGTSESALQLQQWTVDYAAVELKHNDLDDYNETNRRLHVEPSGSQAIYKCKYCPQAFASSQYLKTHVRKSHVCKYCTCAFAKFKDLNDHIRNKHPNHPCVVCTNTFSTSRYLRAHLKRVHGVHLPAQVALLDYRPASRKQYNPD